MEEGVREFPNMTIPKHFVLDVDGVMTDGTMIYTAGGKLAKVFGPDDHDALLLLQSTFPISIEFVSSDARGWDITKARIVDDMGFKLYRMPGGEERVNWIRLTCGLHNTIYMGDSFTDIPVLKVVRYGIAPADAHEGARRAASYVSRYGGGHRAVADACLHIIERWKSDVPQRDTPRDRERDAAHQAGADNAAD